MKKELREKIIAYNKQVKAKGEKANDMDVLIKALTNSPVVRQIVKLLPDEVKEVLRKYGFEV